jgi:hypothetical protein
MKPAIAITTTILACVLTAGLASAQSPRVIQNTRNTMNGVSNNATAASNNALGIHQAPSAPANNTHAPARPPKVVGVTSMQPASPYLKNRRKRAAGIVATGGVIVAVPRTGDNAPEGTAVVGSATANVGGENAPEGQNTTPDSKYNANGRRDPFVSPVVSHAGGSGCSTGKKCLEIGAINLRGVVHSDGGFIAVVSNGLNKAYFLRENDPVFNGYVVKITGDSIVFQETLQDRLGKTFRREVVKKITTPAV